MPPAFNQLSACMGAGEGEQASVTRDSVKIEIVKIRKYKR
jgi:hypothetical protein